MYDIHSPYLVWKPPNWTAERIATLIRLAGQGLSARRISVELGEISRNAVIGKLSRLGVKLQNAQGNHGPHEKRTLRPRPQRNGGGAIASMQSRQRMDRDMASRNVASAQVAGELEPLVTSLPPLLSDRPRVQFMELESGMCRFPFGDVGKPDFGFCGEPADGPYCGCHKEMAFAGTKRRAQRITDAERARRKRQGRKFYAEVFHV